MSPVPVASESIDETASRRASRWSVWAVALLLVPNALVFGVRLINTVQKGAYVETTGTEPVPIYGVWKAQHGHPVYEQPFEGSFAVSLYNFGFYHSYGAVARLFGWEGGGLILGARTLGALGGIRHSYVHLASVFVPSAYLWLAPLASCGSRQEGKGAR